MKMINFYAIVEYTRLVLSSHGYILHFLVPFDPGLLKPTRRVDDVWQFFRKRPFLLFFALRQLYPADLNNIV